MFKNNQLFLWILFLHFIFLFASCFEIIEEVNLNDDGSGSFCFTINMSQSKVQINSMLLLDSVNGRPVPNVDEMKEAIRKVEKELKKDNLISKVLIKEDWEEYIFSVSGEFQNIDALNSAIKNINTIFSKPGGYSIKLHDNFKYSNNTFERFYNYNLVNDYNKLSEKDKDVFKNAKYTTIYRFLNPVKMYSNPEALKSKSGKAVMLKIDIKDLITNRKTIQNAIRLR